MTMMEYLTPQDDKFKRRGIQKWMKWFPRIITIACVAFIISVPLGKNSSEKIKPPSNNTEVLERKSK